MFESPPPPAWVELDPKPGRWCPVALPLARRILQPLGLRGELRERNPPTPGLDGHYALVPTNETMPLFLKVVSGKRARNMVAAEDIARYLAGNGVRALAALPGFPKALDSERLVFAYPLIAYRFSQPTASDAKAMGKLLAALHRTLRRFPDRGRVRERSRRMDARIGEIREGPSRAWREIVPEDLCHSAHVYPASAGQPVHGDLNYGNILFDGGGRPILIDFENSLHSWWSPAVDLAWILERHMLVHVQDDEPCLALGETFFRSYVEFNPGAPTALELLEVLRIKALRPLLLLSDGPRLMPEIEKFQFLSHEIVRRKSLIEALDRTYRHIRYAVARKNGSGMDNLLQPSEFDCQVQTDQNVKAGPFSGA